MRITDVGEGTLNGFARTVEAAIHELKPLIVGMDPFQVEAIALRLSRDVYSDGGQIQGSALAAIEFATRPAAWSMPWVRPDCSRSGRARCAGAAAPTLLEPIVGPVQRLAFSYQ